MAGKGSKSRPFSVTQEEYGNNWDNIFKKDKKSKKIQPGRIKPDRSYTAVALIQPSQ
jgi:hypothetical protein